MANILVVDDSPVILRMLRYTLRKNGHHVITAEDGLQALSILGQTSVDLIISDIAMPEMDGLSLLAEIRTSSQNREVPIIFLSATELLGIREKARAAGVNHFLSKPASSMQLIDTVNRLLR